ncbi:hypothetical protein [Amycolatopsis silviterrae]|uniref:Uncharacterized protein n=1 Tax=Amycolatopsis silviterrae TaxID=1656914 RepID=A0ABW5HAG0_9PSEU
MKRPLTPDERAVLRRVLIGRPLLLAQVDQAEVVSHWRPDSVSVDLVVRNAIPDGDLDGVLPQRAMVAEAGEILVWVTEGVLSGLEYAWYLDPPTALPDASAISLPDVIAELPDWLNRIAEEGGSAHFDELGLSWQDPAQWLTVLAASATALARTDRTVAVVVPLQLRETVPAQVDWDLVKSTVHDQEPPSVAVIQTAAMRIVELDVEEHRFPLPGVDGADYAYVRYWRDPEEIAAGEAYSGAAYFVRDLPALA